MRYEKEVKRIKSIIKQHGEFRINELGIGDESQVLEFNHMGYKNLRVISIDLDGISVDVLRDGEVVDYDDLDFEQLSEENFSLVLDAVEQWEVECLKTEKRCQN